MAYSDLSGLFTMIQGEAETQELPAALTEKVCHASDYTRPHTFLTFNHIPSNLVKVGTQANHLYRMKDLPRRRLRYFYDCALIMNQARVNAPGSVGGSIIRNLCSGD